MPIQVIILLGLGITAVIWFLKKQLDSDYEQEVVLLTPENDPIMDAIAHQRIAITDNIIDALTAAWQISEEYLDVDIKQLSFKVILVVLVYKNHMFRLYQDWKHNVMRIHYTITNPSGETRVIRKKMRLKANSIDFEKMQTFFRSIKPIEVETAPALTEAQVDKLINAAKELKEEGKISHEDANSILMDFWDESKGLVMEEGTRENTMQFTAMTVLLYEYCPDEFKKHLSEIKDDKQISKNHESAD